VNRQLTSSIEIERPAESIIDALLDSSHLANWWGVDKAFIEQRVGGLYVLAWLWGDTGVRFVQTAKISLLNKRSYLHLEDVIYVNAEKGIFGPFTIRFEIENINDSSLLKVTQDGFRQKLDQKWYYEMMADSWPQVLLFLKQYLERL